MALNIEIKIEPSTSGKTFGIALHKVGADKPFAVIKGCRMASGSNGEFASGPSTKMDDGKWFNYLYMEKDFGNYVTKLAQEVAPKQQSRQGAAPDDDEIPFAPINRKHAMVM